MGRRRTIGETRSAGAGRRCSHRNALVEIAHVRGPTTFRCGRCNQDVPAEIAVALGVFLKLRPQKRKGVR